jgi:hypothetical protein
MTICPDSSFNKRAHDPEVKPVISRPVQRQFTYPPDRLTDAE